LIIKINTNIQKREPATNAKMSQRMRIGKKKFALEVATRYQKALEHLSLQTTLLQNNRVQTLPLFGVEKPKY